MDKTVIGVSKCHQLGYMFNEGICNLNKKVWDNHQKLCNCRGTMHTTLHPFLPEASGAPWHPVHSCHGHA